MASPSANDPSRDGKISILLKEWDTLRAEILARMESRYQLLTFTVVAATFLFSQEELGNIWRFIGLAAVSFVVWVAWAGFRRAIERCAERIREIERKVNDLVGDELLQWEQQVQGNASSLVGGVGFLANVRVCSVGRAVVHSELKKGYGHRSELRIRNGFR